MRFATGCRIRIAPRSSPSATKCTSVPAPSGSNDHVPSIGCGTLDDVRVDAHRSVELGEFDDLLELLPAGGLRALPDTRAELRRSVCQLLYRRLGRLPSGEVGRVREVIEDDFRRLADGEC